jgi:myo-inositol-1(or 4)-monophosphatase
VSLTRDVDVALAAVEAGAAVVRRCFGSALQRLEKGGGDFATSADVEAERAMVGLVRRERPDVPLAR